MDSYVVAFIRSSLIWLAIGVTLGLWLVFDPQAILYRPAHLHANLLGFVSMMIFGVAYHVLPRFSGRALHSARLARMHVWLANAGLLGMVSGFMLRHAQATAGALLLQVGGVVSATGVLFFIINIWQTVGRAGIVSIAGAAKNQRKVAQ